MKNEIIKVLAISAVVILFNCDSKGQKQVRKPPQIEQMMKDLDSNKDGKLSMEEFKKGAPEKFKMMDENKDGFLTLEELKKDKQQGRKSPEEIIKDLDADKNGKLSKAEVKGPIKDKFTTIDDNDDGYISLDELKKFKPKPGPKPKR